MSSTVRYTTAPDPSSPPSQTSAQASTRKREAVELETGSSSGTRQAGVLDAAPTVSISDFKNIYKVPCARDAFLVGIGTGFAVGGVRLVAGCTYEFSFQTALRSTGVWSRPSGGHYFLLFAEAPYHECTC